ncbi:MAG: 4-phospho-D-threonate 3-dehydrogenase, partial [Mixta sp.]
MTTKTIAVTMGDPAGIGPEIIIKALSEGELNGAPAVVVGCLETLRRVMAQGHSPQVELKEIASVAQA